MSRHYGNIVKQHRTVFGGRDHTTVMHAVKTVKDKQLSNSQMKRMISTIRKELGFNFL